MDEQVEVHDDIELIKVPQFDENDEATFVHDFARVSYWSAPPLRHLGIDGWPTPLTRCYETLPSPIAVRLR